MKKNLTATYDHDVNGYHRFKVDRGQGLTGALCIPKDKAVPDSVTIRLRTKAEAETEAKRPSQALNWNRLPSHIAFGVQYGANLLTGKAGDNT